MGRFSSSVVVRAASRGSWHATLSTWSQSTPHRRCSLAISVSVSAANVSYVEADIFDWEPPHTYDLVFFGFLLSHVPPTFFERFWQLVGNCLRTDGRVVFVDEDHRIAHYDDLRVVDGVPVASPKAR